MGMARFLSGACQVILAIYLPVWVDAFAPQDKKTTWMTLTIIAAPKGVLVGYGLSALVLTLSIDWEWAFYILVLSMVPLLVLLFLTKKSLINIQEHLKSI